METVGAATWAHSLKSLRPGGTVVISGATSGPNPAATELNRIFFLQLRVVGSTMGTRDELERLMRVLRADRRAAGRSTRCCRWSGARDGFARMAAGDLVGKIVFTRP